MKRTISLLLAATLLQSLHAQSQKILGFFDKNVPAELKFEAAFDQGLDAQSIGANIKRLSDAPHHLGSTADKKNAEYIRDWFRSNGWDARIETFYVLFPTPATRILEMTAPQKYVAVLKEPALKEDATSGQSGQLPTYNAYSADGDVTAELVYVNYGLPEDYELLDRMGIDVKGKIVIAKYGRSWRGIKPKVAQEHGAVGCIIYSDPMDDGYFQGDVYPKGPFRNEYGVQRGSVMDMPIYPGDPLTPGIGATKDAKRLDRKDAGNLLKIPVLPISYHDAAPLLQSLDSRTLPAGWQGGLPFAYHTGPGKTVVHLKLNFHWDIVPAYDVIAMIKGSKYPDEWVIRGNHHDAWVNGADDPISGQAAMLEEAKSIGNLLKNGWTPERTLVYCAWDGEEPALLGSTEWVEEHLPELRTKAVVYINSDANGRGYLFGEGSPELEPFVDEIAKEVIDPQTHLNLFARIQAHDLVMAQNPKARKMILDRKDMTLEAMGSGSDYSSFIQHAGVPSLNLGFGGEDRGGDYHSIYDSYDLFARFKDPGFHYGVALAETAGRAVLRMADADIVPFDYGHLFKAVDGYTKSVMTLLQNSRDSIDMENLLIRSGDYRTGVDPTWKLLEPGIKAPVPYLDFSPLQNALAQLKPSTDSLNAVIQKVNASGNPDDTLNTLLFRAEQQLLSEKGLPQREWYRHTLYAPGFYTGYGVKTLPGIREAIEQRKWGEAQEQIGLDAKAILRLSDYFNTLDKKVK